jgi:hypothetical protein
MSVARHVILSLATGCAPPKIRAIEEQIRNPQSVRILVARHRRTAGDHDPLVGQIIIADVNKEHCPFKTLSTMTCPFSA